MPRDRLAGSETGVFVGAHTQNTDYVWLTLDRIDQMSPFTATGTAQNLLAGRLSYFFDLRGPSLVVDTACSSSLVAVHLACQSLRSGACRAARAAGGPVNLTPHNPTADANRSTHEPTASRGVKAAAPSC
jgi:acyl transferase domain-containing protein